MVVVVVAGYHAVTVDVRQICQTLGKLFSPVFIKNQSLHEIAVTTCPAKSVGLVRYPAMLAQVSGSVTVTAHCADNAHVFNSILV